LRSPDFNIVGRDFVVQGLAAARCRSPRWYGRLLSRSSALDQPHPHQARFNGFVPSHPANNNNKPKRDGGFDRAIAL
jgi:hypothetical protein